MMVGSVIRCMTVYNAEVDPYRPEGGYYECTECGARVETDGICEGCGCDALVNIAVPRE